MGLANFDRRRHDLGKTLLERECLHLCQRFVAVFGDNVGVEIFDSGEDNSSEVSADLRIVGFCPLQYVFGDKITIGCFYRAGAAGVGFPGEDRRSSEELPFLTVIDDHFDAAGRLGRDFHHPFLDHVEVTGGRVVLIEYVDVRRVFFNDCSLFEFGKKVVGKLTERLGIP